MRPPLRREANLGAAALRREAEAAAGALPPLPVAADRVAATVAQGVHGRRRVGQGDSFWQFRRYQPGDPAQAVDWRQSAKSRFAFVRETEWDAAQSVWLWADASASMRYRSSDRLPDKAGRAALLALALASLLVRGGERIALLGAGVAPSSSRAALDRMADHLATNHLAAAAQRGPSLPAPQPLPRHGRLVLIGDMLSPLDEIDPLVRGYAARGVRGHLLQLLDPVEETLPFHGRIRFRGLEGEGAALVGRVEAVRGEYAALLRAHRQGLADLARAVGWTFAMHRTDRSPQSALLALHRALAEG